MIQQSKIVSDIPLLVGFVALTSSPVTAQVSLIGAGATFPDPI
jgi:hypothetical protein